MKGLAIFCFFIVPEVLSNLCFTPPEFQFNWGSCKINFRIGTQFATDFIRSFYMVA